MYSNNSAHNQSGALLVSIIILMFFIVSMILSLSVLSNANIARASQRILSLQAQYAAESGADAAVSFINQDTTYTGTGAGTQQTLINGSNYRATYETVVGTAAMGPSGHTEKTITSIGRVYQPASSTIPTTKYTIRLVAELNSANQTAAVLSRNSVEISSAVKNVVAKSLYVNEYVKMNKNSSTLTIENITVGGKYPDASNCSITGSGSIEKPSTSPKTTIKLAYNQCISLSGPASDFTVLQNQSNISKVTSTYIPYSHTMNGTYTNRNSCTDWIAGSSTSTINIPATAGAKNTHYPNTSSGVDVSCGSSGNIDLDGRTIILGDHVHIRADLCRTAACTPTFINPTAGTTKFVYVEGAINFDRIYTGNDSAGKTYNGVNTGSIVFVSYSGNATNIDNKSCPNDTAAIRIGKKTGSDQEVIAPRAYFISINGMLCIDQTKFPGSTSGSGLGGISGKDLYISANSGGVFDLAFDPEFPLTDVPVDLAWRASRYERVLN